MCARQHAYFAADRAQIAVAAAIDALLFFQNTDAKRLLLHVIEGLRDSERIGFGMFFLDCGLHFLAQSVHGFGARHLAFGIKRLFDAVARNAVSDVEELLIHLKQRGLAFRSARHCRQLFLNANHLTRIPVRELECFYEFSFRHFLCRAFDHDHIVFSADVNKVEIALGPLVVCRISNELTVNATDAHRANRPCKRNIRNAQRGGRAVECENIGIILAIGAKQDGDDLCIVKISLWKKWPQRPIDHARSECFLLCRTAFAFEVAAREFSGGRRFLAVINCQRKEILTFFDC